jgi:hypothetical protein
MSLIGLNLLSEAPWINVVERNQWVNWLCFNLSLNFGHIANRSEPPTVGETFLAWICLLRRQQSQIVHQWRCASLSVLIAEIYDEYREVLHSCIRFLSGHSESVEDVAARYALILLSIHGNSFLSRVDSLRLVSLQHVVAILLRAASKLVRQSLSTFVAAADPHVLVWRRPSNSDADFRLPHCESSASYDGVVEKYCPGQEAPFCAGWLMALAIDQCSVTAPHGKAAVREVMACARSEYSECYHDEVCGDKADATVSALEAFVAGIDCGCTSIRCLRNLHSTHLGTALTELPVGLLSEEGNMHLVASSGQGGSIAPARNTISRQILKEYFPFEVVGTFS